MSAARHDGNVELPGGKGRTGRAETGAGWRRGWGEREGLRIGCRERCSDERMEKGWRRMRNWNPRPSLAGESAGGALVPPVWW